MTQGVTLIAVGNKGYLDWAVNMAASIKHHSPKVKIQIITNSQLAPKAKTWPQFFDVFTVLKEEDYTENGILFPAKLKLSLPRHLYWDKTLYFDVDGCVVRDITPLFETKADLSGDIQGVYDLSQGELFNHLKWCKPAVIWEYYALGENARLPAINSSYMFIRRGDLVNKIFKQAYDNLMNNPIPYEKHWHTWGKKRAHKITQPDELYFDIALAQCGYVPEHKVAVYFRLITEGGTPTKLQWVKENYYAVGLFGDLRTNHSSCRDMYDVEMKNVWMATTGQNFYMKSHLLGKSKFVIA